MDNWNLHFFFLKFLFLITIEIIYSQQLFYQNFEYNSSKIKFNSGTNWEKLSSLNSNGPTLFSNSNKNSLDSKIGLGSLSAKGELSFYGTGMMTFKKNFFFFYSNILSNSNNKIYKNNKLGLSASGIGFRNNWFLLQLGKNTEDWGAGNEISLALNYKSYPYNYFTIASDYGKIRVKYIHGFIEKTSDGINRYLNGRGIEWTNKKSAVVSLSEIIIYSGKNRSFDFSYLNPISTHLEIELNNRLNTPGNANSNAVWQIHLDFLIKNHSRFSLNYLFDEFVLDPDIEIGKEHGRAYSLKYVFFIKGSNKRIFNLFISHTLVGTPTFRHGLGTNNFVNQNRPLGWEYGSDGLETMIGLSFLKTKEILGQFSIGIVETGDETIVKRSLEPYKDYLKEKFPSGEIDHILFLRSEIQKKIHNNLSITLSSEINNKTNQKNFQTNIIIKTLYYF